MSDWQLAFDRQTAMQLRGGLNHLIQDQRDRFSPEELRKLRCAQIILRDFMERTRCDVDGTI